MRLPIEILEFPSNLGLKAFTPGKEPGVRKLPEWLKHHGFYDLIAPVKIHSLPPPPYSMNLDAETGIRNADAIAAYAGEQAKILKDVVADKSFSLVIGGDCSILIGTMLGLRQLGNYGLFFLDGHTDYMGVELSSTGGAAGMDLAIVAGKGPDKLTNIGGLKSYVQEEHVWCVGNRTFDRDYVNLIKHSAIHYFDLYRLRAFGIKKCIEDFFDMVERNKLDGFWIHLDVDVLDDAIMPAVDSRQSDGLTYEEISVILKKLIGHEGCVGLQLTILDPDLDPSGEYTKVFVDRIGNAIKGN